jgi:hypothetical protein
MKTVLLVVLCCTLGILLVTAGCTQTAQPTPTPTPVPTIVPTETPTAVPTPLPTTPTPVPTTIAPAIPLPKMIRDTQLLFTVSAPNGYAGTTIRAPTSAYNILYKTTIFNPAVSGANRTITDNSGTYIELPDSLTIFSYSSSLSVDQNIRNIIRGSGAAFNESAATYNGITYVRFDGYLPVMIYTMTSDDTLSQATYENMVMSFRYYTGRNIGSALGEETDRPPFYQ